MTRSALLLLLVACGRDPNQPPPIAWDHEACDACGMLVSEPRHAAEIVTRAGEALVFDDPGCLFEYTLRQKPSIERAWFHGEGEQWHDFANVAFLTNGSTPMGSGLLAVPKGTEGAVSFEEASGIALAKNLHGQEQP